MWYIYSYSLQHFFSVMAKDWGEKKKKQQQTSINRGLCHNWPTELSYVWIFLLFPSPSPNIICPSLTLEGKWHKLGSDDLEFWESVRPRWNQLKRLLSKQNRTHMIFFLWENRAQHNHQVRDRSRPQAVISVEREI